MLMYSLNSRDIRRRPKAPPNNAINSGMQKRRFALLFHAGYGER